MNHAFVAALAAAGHTAESLAGQLGVHPKTVARWANPGHIPQSRHRATVAGLLAKDADALWPDVVRRREPVWFRPWVDLEREAVTLRSFQLAWVPGLLQTEAYARATLAGGVLTPEAVAEFAEARINRQAILGRGGGPLLIAVLDEGVLRRRVGDDRALMAVQLARLLGHAETRRRATPHRPGGRAQLSRARRTVHHRRHAGRVTGRARRQRGTGADPRSTSDLVSLERRWERIRGEALPRGRSLELLREAAASWT